MTAVHLAALLGASIIAYLKSTYDRLGAERDLKWLLSLWYIVTPWAHRRWIWKIWGLCLWACHQNYHLRQKRKLEKATIRTDILRYRKAWKHGLYNNSFDYGELLSPLKPVIFQCETSHTRLFPKKHSFSYSYLFVGIPVGWRGKVSAILSADLKTLPWRQGQPKNGWFNVDSDDYLARGQNLYGLRGKLDDYLESQSEDLEDYPYAYLVTAPRLLGYSFNPVSFWYLYNHSNKLTAMILEVNNTFDERRMYFLKNQETNKLGEEPNNVPAEKNQAPENLEDKETTTDGNPTSKFTAAWPKDFHVSPFNSRKGHYSLSASDPFTNHLLHDHLKASSGRVNNTITLTSSQNHPKLIARVFSTSDSVDPYAFSEWQVWKFVISWFWVGLVTFPRIVKEAGVLFFVRRLGVWFRPEVLEGSIGRMETGDERAIAFLFRDYLKSLVEASNLPVPVQFISGIATMPPSETFTPISVPPTSSSSSSPHPAPLILKPSTPLFYALLARHSNIPAFISMTISNPDPKTATFHTSDANLLLQLFEKPYVSRANLTAVNSEQTSRLLLESLRWTLLHRIRRHPRFESPLDAFAIRPHHSDSEKDKARAYRRATLTLLVSDRLAFGAPGLLDLVLFGIRIWLCWLCVQSSEALLGGVWRGSGNAGWCDIGWTFFGAVGVVWWSAVGDLL